MEYENQYEFRALFACLMMAARTAADGGDPEHNASRSVADADILLKELAKPAPGTKVLAKCKYCNREGSMITIEMHEGNCPDRPARDMPTTRDVTGSPF